MSRSRGSNDSSGNDVVPATVGALVQQLESGMTEFPLPPGVASSGMYARDIVAALLNVPRSWPSAYADHALAPEIVPRAIQAVEQLGRGAPFAYAVGRAAFRHLTLHVDRRVLIPRPETELIVDEVFRLIAEEGVPRGGTVVDVGTGSGAIALALATENRPVDDGPDDARFFSRIIATDISPDALAVAEANAARLASALRTTLEFRHGSLLAPVKDALQGERATVVVSNPPYIAPDEVPALPASVWEWEPALALVSDDGGMAATREIVREAADILHADGALLLEVDERRAGMVAGLAEADPRYHSPRILQDLAGRDRFVVARRSRD